MGTPAPQGSNSHSQSSRFDRIFSSTQENESKSEEEESRLSEERVHAAADRWQRRAGSGSPSRASPSSEDPSVRSYTYRQSHQARSHEQFEAEFASRFSAAAKMAREHWGLHPDSKAAHPQQHPQQHAQDQAAPAWMSEAEVAARVELGLSPGEPLTPPMLKKAFQQLARVRHPDAPGGSSSAFHRLREAHALLTDLMAQRQPGQPGRPGKEGATGAGSHETGSSWDNPTVVRP